MGAAPSLQGQSGYINMPSAVVEADGTISSGYSYDRPYSSFWLSATVLPFFQFTGRYVGITGVRGFSDIGGDYGKNYRTG
ncbi:YjbH domain-containing protein [Massilia phosphatilytica]